MSAKKKIILAISIALFILVIRLITVPACIKHDWALSGFNRRYYSADYSTLLDTSQVEKTIIYSGIFVLDKTLNRAESKRLLKLLLDSTTYDWGEWGTAEYSKTFYYVDSEGQAMGKTAFDPIGQTYTSPSTEKQIKWGQLSDKGLAKVLEIIH